MKTVVITGSARGFGFAMAKDFRKLGCNVVLSEVKQESLDIAIKELGKIQSDAKAITVVCDVTKSDMLENLWQQAKHAFGNVDIWINNAGVNQPDLPVCMLTEADIDFLLNVDFYSIYSFRNNTIRGNSRLCNTYDF